MSAQKRAAFGELRALIQAVGCDAIERHVIEEIFARHGVADRARQQVAQALVIAHSKTLPHGGDIEPEKVVLGRLSLLVHATPEAAGIVSIERGQFPRFVFKYTMREYAEKMVASGEALVRNLYYFRDVERLGPKVGDANEGKAFTEEFVEFLNPADDSNLSWVAREFAPSFQGIERAIIQNNLFQVRQDEPNCYLYCVTHRFDPQAMRNMKYDTAVLIRDVGEFGRALHAGLMHADPKLPDEMLFDACVYGPRNRKPSDPRVWSALLKEPDEYSEQVEGRFLWPMPAGSRLPSDACQLVVHSGIAAASEIIEPPDYEKWFALSANLQA